MDDPCKECIVDYCCSEHYKCPLLENYSLFILQKSKEIIKLWKEQQEETKR